MKLTIIPSDGLENWYTIERAEHEHKGGFEKVGPDSFAYRWSGRISDADVEGSGGEMLAIAEAIKARKSVRFKRCMVEVVGNEAHFASPRNSRVDGVCSLEEADALAAEIFALLVMP